MTSVIYCQHMSTVIKAFEELLQASDVDSCVPEGFQEQLTQCAELPEQLEKLVLHGALAGAETRPQRKLQERLRTEEDNLTHHHLLPDSPGPSASHTVRCLEHLQLEHTSVKGGNERLQRDISEKQRHSRQLTQEICSRRQELSSDLHGLLTEMRALREQLERSIQTYSTPRSSCHREQRRPRKGPSLWLSPSQGPVTEWSLQLDKHDGDERPEVIDNSFDLSESTQAMTLKSACETPPLSGTDVDSLQ
ncbi:hypothetical protein U0070_023233 [Myodes glareolus]|uniref:Uncharacterized protein n=1 Tax=Myodes glareolus TaxID=447135 RepID=A0AAW0HD30_MYOGA